MVLVFGHKTNKTGFGVDYFGVIDLVNPEKRVLVYRDRIDRSSVPANLIDSLHYVETGTWRTHGVFETFEDAQRTLFPLIKTIGQRYAERMFRVHESMPVTQVYSVSGNPTTHLTNPTYNPDKGIWFTGVIQKIVADAIDAAVAEDRKTNGRV